MPSKFDIMTHLNELNTPADAGASRHRNRRNFLRTSLAASLATLGATGAGSALADLTSTEGAARLAADNTARRTVVIDCDPGQDDAIAILFALGAHDQIDLKALTAVGGNVPLNLTERNARIVRDWADKTHTLPVYAGCPKPLMRELITAANVHGRTGLDGVTLHEPRGPLAPQHAVTYLIDTLRAAAPGSVTLVALGPLTNIATALSAAPEGARALREIVLMGGAWFERGNITPAAEFNIYVDPEAASIVLGAGVPVTVLPRDVCVKAPITPQRVAPFRALKNRCGPIVADILAAEVAYQKGRRGVESAPMYDPCTIGYLVDPTMFGGRRVNVAVETTGQLTLGETVVDWNGRSKRAVNATWITDVDADRFYETLLARIARLP
ncbi:inosine/uridine-preferring nucleoside hydrolase [Pandoraea apista]|uniref:Inosine/uridine-preferring nucleoside hydrolase n=2 Tax=Pandoraea apista TaxID=93218 RepID=A0A5E5NYL4_9BURK|nr:Pyrimidine-specific ribonucleoside hydrolase RihA [Pandoraea apista]VVG69412.1 inosine/uridine-preferring nucleoside hydrolase [Pandoraea apista]